MTKEQAAALRVGDIIEHSTDINYWLAKLVRYSNSVWHVKNTGKETFGCNVIGCADNFTLVGHSDIP